MKTKLFLTILCVCFSINLHSQEGKIIYTDFEPDSVMTDVPFNAGNHTDTHLLFDINDDNINDFGFYYCIPTSEGINQFFIRDYNEYFSISLDQVGVNVTLSDNYFNDAWVEARLFSGDDKCIGLRMNLGNDNYCYGWIRYKLQTSNPFCIILYDMAYCTIPNYPLRVGQKSLDEAVEEQNIQNNFNIYPNPATNTVKILSFSTQLSDVEVYNSLGMLVDELEVNSEEVEVNISGYNPGIYFFRIKTEAGKVYTDKIVVK